MLSKIKKGLRRSLEWFKLQNESIQDAQRYFRSASWAGPVPRHHLPHIESELIKHYHVLEKALAMPEFRPRAGAEVLRNLLRLVRWWRDSGGSPQAFHLLATLGVIEAYRIRHDQVGEEIGDLLGDFDPSEFDGLIVAGSTAPTPAPTLPVESIDRFLKSRHSTRNFDPSREVPTELLVTAVRVATSAPSVCNRQTWRVHLYRDDAAQRILSHQNGNRGFGHLIRCLAVVTSDMRLFAGTTERYQSWIEGGLFSMQLLLALHARGIGSIALNWSRSNADDRKLRAEADIPDHERVVMLIGIGYPSNGHLVTCSPRPEVEHFIKWH